ncbi:hypothetical protein GGX14DRAFT_398708 [Mycena pura]|uniref:Uncharacterized protein n=1 Tax=Mycena pura TaxID=153505 RepID=A0AAD6YB70_9AGAR|nr:hypothetical protein GGX14DRAFT_398708 [Mycena pura]
MFREWVYDLNARDPVIAPFQVTDVKPEREDTRRTAALTPDTIRQCSKCQGSRQSRPRWTIQLLCNYGETPKSKDCKTARNFPRLCPPRLPSVHGHLFQLRQVHRILRVLFPLGMTHLQVLWARRQSIHAQLLRGAPNNPATERAQNPIWAMNLTGGMQSWMEFVNALMRTLARAEAKSYDKPTKSTGSTEPSEPIEDVEDTVEDFEDVLAIHEPQPIKHSPHIVANEPLSPSLHRSNEASRVAGIPAFANQSGSRHITCDNLTGAPSLRIETPIATLVQCEGLYFLAIAQVITIILDTHASNARRLELVPAVIHTHTLSLFQSRSNWPWSLWPPPRSPFECNKCYPPVPIQTKNYQRVLEHNGAHILLDELAETSKDGRCTSNGLGTVRVV